ncbi:hypothetical protein FKW77_000083 [Venturia effusa]|uniref:Sulfatase N-terminal domain-containing protein n=1 Tax=Venturia effusa TaxID=50376 RepID=A0A517LHV1_9PEZI|nr:hypothetical protein FKW77_000083 [Venturia effusa]
MKFFSCAIKAFAVFGSFGWIKSVFSLSPIERENDRPNVVVILTDDQDTHLNSMDYLPLVKRHMTDKGTSFNKHYCTVALCCPSRVTLWTGKVAHNTVGINQFCVRRILTRSYRMPYGKNKHRPYGSYTLVNELQVDILNSLSLENFDKPFARGFTGNDFLLDPTTYQYLNATIQTNHDPPVSYAGQYCTDVIAGKTLAYIDDALTTSEPFFIVSSPIAPHADQTEEILSATAPVPAGRHKALFQDAKVPRTPNFNPESQNDSNIEYNDEWHRSRLRALQAVDELVDGIINKLASRDNGYHIGQHRLQPGKMCSYEEDVNVPMIIRGPGVQAGATTNLVTSHTDLAPTILSLIGAPQRPDFDGIPIPVRAEDLSLNQKDWHEYVGVEYWGPSVSEGIFDRIPKLRNTYKALRISGSDYSFYYSVWCTNEHELYDMTTDPYQMTNLFAVNGTILPSASSTTLILGRPVSQFIARIDALLLVLKSCKGMTCSKPWLALHPTGDVMNLKQAVSETFDEFYAGQARVEFDECADGYIVEVEGPQFETDGLQYFDSD